MWSIIRFKQWASSYVCVTKTLSHTFASGRWWWLFLHFLPAKETLPHSRTQRSKKRSIKGHSPLPVLLHIWWFCKDPVLRHLMDWGIEHQQLTNSNQDVLEIQLHSHHIHHILHFRKSDLLTCSLSEELSFPDGSNWCAYVGWGNFVLSRT